MKGAITILIVFGAIYFTACSKSNKVQQVSGTINGSPALTLYGSSGNPSDYILLNTNTADKDLSYNGVLYSYITFTGNAISIIVSPNDAVNGTLTTTGSKTILTIVPTTTIFTSTQYTSN